MRYGIVVFLMLGGGFLAGLILFTYSLPAFSLLAAVIRCACLTPAAIFADRVTRDRLCWPITFALWISWPTLAILDSVVFPNGSHVDHDLLEDLLFVSWREILFAIASIGCPLTGLKLGDRIRSWRFPNNSDRLNNGNQGS